MAAASWCHTAWSVVSCGTIIDVKMNMKKVRPLINTCYIPNLMRRIMTVSWVSHDLNWNITKDFVRKLVMKAEVF